MIRSNRRNGRGLVTNFRAASQDFTGSKVEKMSREQSGVETEMKNGREFSKFKSSEQSHKFREDEDGALLSFCIKQSIGGRLL